MMIPAEDLAPLAQDAADRYGVDAAALLAQAHKESTFNPQATSGGGKFLGLLQVSRDVFARFGPRGASWADPAANLQAGAAYLGQLVRQFGGQLQLGLAAYNWGPGNLSKALKAAGSRSWEAVQARVPGRVRYYVSKIMLEAPKYQGLVR